MINFKLVPTLASSLDNRLNTNELSTYSILYLNLDTKHDDNNFQFQFVEASKLRELIFEERAHSQLAH